jgi:hypothetical protein
VQREMVNQRRSEMGGSLRRRASSAHKLDDSSGGKGSLRLQTALCV